MCHKQNQHRQHGQQQHVKAANAFCFVAQSFIIVLVLVDLLQCWSEILGQRQTNQNRPGFSCRRHSHKVFRILEHPFFRRLLKFLQVGKRLTQHGPRTRQVPACHGSVVANRHGKTVLQRVLMAAKFVQHAAVIGGFKRMLNFWRLRDVHRCVPCAVTLLKL